MKKFCSILLLCFIQTACVEDYNTYFPVYQVNFQINLATGGLALNGIGGYYVKDPKNTVGTDKIGCGGVLVYHTAIDTYSAFDLACPVEVSRSYLISTPDSKGIVTCSKCGSTFNIFHGMGNPESGPAVEKKRMLKSYRTSLSGTMLNVYN